MAVAATAALGLSSCSETWDGNPVYEGHDGVLKADFLNNPQLKDQYIMLTTANQDGSFHLTCSQPDYGYAAAAAYRVQLSLTEGFEKYEEISQAFYDCAQINPLNKDVAMALEKLSGVQTDDDLPLPYQTLYVRLRSEIPQSPANSQFISNVVSFKGVSADYLAIWVSGVPVNIYLRGGMNGWGAPAEWQFKTGPEENTWVLSNVTIEAGTEFKVADPEWGALNLGGGDVSDVKPGEKLALSGGGSNLKIDEDFTGLIQLRLENGIYYLTLDPSN